MILSVVLLPEPLGPEQSVHFARFDAEAEILYCGYPASGMEWNRKDLG